MTASAADWLPTGGKRPDFPDGTQCFVRDMYSGELGPLRIEWWQWGPITHYRLVAPLPAQPVEGEAVTINAGAARGSESTRDQSVDSSVRENVTDCPTPVPAPQRQNLALWLALRGRAPWPEAPRVILSSLPVNSYKRHPK